jgi:hypothetical protein
MSPIAPRSTPARRKTTRCSAPPTSSPVSADVAFAPKKSVSPSLSRSDPLTVDLRRVLLVCKIGEAPTLPAVVTSPSAAPHRCDLPFRCSPPLRPPLLLLDPPHAAPHRRLVSTTEGRNRTRRHRLDPLACSGRAKSPSRPCSRMTLSSVSLLRTNLRLPRRRCSALGPTLGTGTRISSTCGLLHFHLHLHLQDPVSSWPQEAGTGYRVRGSSGGVVEGLTEGPSPTKNAVTYASTNVKHTAMVKVVVAEMDSVAAREVSVTAAPAVLARRSGRRGRKGKSPRRLSMSSRRWRPG